MATAANDNMIKNEIREIIVVEGRDDTNAINRAVGAVTIETHGFGISKETWNKLDAAYKERGLIIFTDPDHAGNEIRRRLKERYPEAKEAFLSREKAKENPKNVAGENPSKLPDIGIENASPEDIREALSKARATFYEDSVEEGEWIPYTIEDLERGRLVGAPDSKERREKLGDLLGIGYSNGKTLLKKLNGMRISKEEFHGSLFNIDN